MRTTIDLPEEILRRAQEQAARQGVDVSQFLAVAIGRQVGVADGATPVSTAPCPRSPLPTIRGRETGTIPSVTPELQSQAQEEDDLASYRRSFGR
jgi:hypothetical protein